MLLNSSESEVKALGVNLTEPQLLIEMDELEWSMDEFLKKAADFAPTLVLIKDEERDGVRRRRRSAMAEGG
jgi:hypothetical protein